MRKRAMSPPPDEDGYDMPGEIPDDMANYAIIALVLWQQAHDIEPLHMERITV